MITNEAICTIMANSGKVPTIIAAVAENNIIGKNNRLIWHLPADMKFFRNTTMGHPLIMGRKTFESFGKPLPGRRSIVITRQNDWNFPGVEVAHSLEEAIAMIGDNQEFFIIGGAEIYRQTLPLCRKMYLTVIHQNFDGDTCFPEFDISEWELIHDEKHAADEKNHYPYSFRTYIRKETIIRNDKLKTPDN